MAAFFVRRPIVAIVIAIVTVLAGLVSMQALPIAQFPNIVPPQIIVTGTYTGADAVTIEQSVATPLEQQVNGVDDMLYMQSTNGNDGSMQLTVTFDIDTDPNIDQVNVQNRLAQAQPNLPTDVAQYGLTMRKVTGLPMMVASLFSPGKSYDALFLANYANINIVDALYRVPGVGEVRIFGAGDYAMRIWVKPDRLATLGLTVPDLSRAIQQQSAVNPSGQIGARPGPGQEMTYTVRAHGRLQTAEEFGEIVLRSNPDGSIVRMKDVARIELGALNYQQIGRVNGQPGVGVAVFQAPGSNALAVAAGVRKQMDEIKARFPNDLDFAYTLDTTLPVSEGIKEILKTLVEALILVIIVVFLFLQNWRATLIPMLAVPVSLIGTFAVFPLLGFSINTLSLFGLVLAIGLVVDDAIVVVEAVEHHIEEGMSPKDATLKAMSEVSGPVIGIALILAAVFIPVGVMSGIQGRLNQQFAITIAVSVLISAFNALTLSPALSAMLLRPRKKTRGPLGRFFDRFNGWLEKGTNGYVSLSHGLIRKPLVGLGVLLLFTTASGVLGMRLPSSFLPEEDYGYALLNIQLPPAASLDRTDAVARKVDDLLKKTEGIKGFNTIVGFSLLTRVTASNNAFYFVQFTPWDERHAPALQARAIVNKLNGQFRQIAPEAAVFAIMPPSIPGLGSQGGFSLWLQDRSGGSVDFLNEQLQKFLTAARARPELAGVQSPFTAAVPQIYADVDRDKVLRQGVALGDVYQTMQAFLGGLYVNQFNRFGRQWRVFLQAEGDDRQSAEQIGQFYVRNGTGTMVPLSAVQSTSQTFGPQFTNRFNVYRAAQITGTAAPGYSSGQAMAALEEVARQTLPREIGYDWSDLSYQERQASGTTGMIFGLSLVFVFLILAALYESWSLPFSVLLTVPIAVFGAFLGLILRKLDLDVYAQIGIIMLIGLAAKNAILIVEFAKYRLEEGKDVVHAALEGARLRLRPILMTSFAFILGCVPLWMAAGSGAASRRILGTVVITGMLAATLIAIFLIPMLFVLIERFATRRGESHAPREVIATSLLVLAIAGAAVGASGCATVGPDYKRPAVTAPETFRGQSDGVAGAAGAAAAQQAASAGDQKWWELFEDEPLRELIKTAIAQNDDLKIAAARILQAQAQLGITRADQFPTIEAQAQGQGQRSSVAAGSGGDARTFGVAQLGVSTSWEIDFWGKYRRATESARAQILASEWGRRAIVTSLVSQVATGYFSLRGLDFELEISQRTLETRKESLRLTQVRESGGATSLVDVRQAEQLVHEANGQIVDLRRRIEQQENFLSVLLARNPGPIARGRSLSDQPHAPELPAGLPSALLERRPDIQQAEQVIVSANAEIGVARAAYFPSITLTGSGGVASTALSALFTGSGGAWTAAAAVAQPIFNAGRNRNRVALADARTQEAVIAYQQTIRQAFREVSDAMVGYRRSREFRETQELLVGAARDARRLADLRYQGGATSYLEVLDSDTRLFTAELGLARAQLDEIAAFVEIYRALGGGWQA